MTKKKNETQVEKWDFTDEHRKMVPEWVERWTKVCLSTEPVDEEKCTAAIKGMYAAADLDAENLRVVYVPSLEAGLRTWTAAAAIWYFRSEEGKQFAKELWEASMKFADETVEEELAEQQSKLEQLEAEQADVPRIIRDVLSMTLQAAPGLAGVAAPADADTTSGFNEAAAIALATAEAPSAG